MHGTTLTAFRPSPLVAHSTIPTPNVVSSSHLTDLVPEILELPADGSDIFGAANPQTPYTNNPGPDPFVMLAFEAETSQWDSFNFADVDNLLFEQWFPDVSFPTAQLQQSVDRLGENTADPLSTKQKFTSIATRVERLWFTRLDRDGCSTDIQREGFDNPGDSGCATPDEELHPHQEITEIYRQSLSNKLHPQWPARSLPSSEFLVSLQVSGMPPTSH